MTLLGLDFDNTLVRYDKLFHQLAVEKSLVDAAFPASKVKIRDYLRRTGQEKAFTLLQGEVYGLRILEAEPAKGVLEALEELKQQGISMVIVSHKTKRPYEGPNYDLHEAAWKWLEKHNFFNRRGLTWSKKQVYFETTKAKKLKKIESLKCTHYVDDLPEILMELTEEIVKINMDPVNEYRKEGKIIRLNDWSQLKSCF